ncbi:PepSY domain-containing protein [Alkalimarinus alittae]|uniref:PepSY domain-containing protein n=1 Tax=Alkalimarinus alittae TaxID=2961619 RepID=A0ABY6N090_9ALTE|nr:PepSY domain-containing protein [Alkalimarinus alittae]UZE95460.1 PepSY domain-containing protein [Alkalimarinus alittae]
MFILNNETKNAATNRRPATLVSTMLQTICFVLLISTATMASTQQVNAQQRSSSDKNQSASISREEAISIAKQGKESKVLKVKIQQRSSGSIYRVKLLTNEGRVKQVVINAATGQIER